MDDYKITPVCGLATTPWLHQSLQQIQEETECGVFKYLTFLIKLLFGKYKHLPKAEKKAALHFTLHKIHQNIHDCPSAFSHQTTKDLNSVLSAKHITVDMLANCILDLVYQNDPTNNPLYKLKHEILENTIKTVEGCSDNMNSSNSPEEFAKIEKLMHALKDKQSVINML
ncbi:MAG: hypothetical protein S4CHLAM37_12250 [Chlamydiia bacterium]|nr:hypothetical protein [Chlamydiia bacterium]